MSWSVLLHNKVDVSCCLIHATCILALLAIDFNNAVLPASVDYTAHIIMLITFICLCIEFCITCVAHNNYIGMNVRVDVHALRRTLLYMH